MWIEVEGMRVTNSIVVMKLLRKGCRDGPVQPTRIRHLWRSMAAGCRFIVFCLFFTAFIFLSFSTADFAITSFTLATLKIVELN